MIRFFKPEEEQLIIQAIQKAENNTSGEIRVHLHKKIKKTLMKDALNTFHRLEMDQTKARNGVLIFIAPKQKQFAILGDQGINELVPDNFWENVKNLMQKHFRSGNFVQGLTEGIDLVGEQLKAYFPYEQDDVNELSDDISYQEEE